MVSRKPLPVSTPAGSAGPPPFRFLLLAAAVAVAGLAGYLGYLAYPRFHLPSVVGAGLLALAAAAGVAAFFSPCAFPLLLTLLARRIRGGAGPAARARAVLVFASAFSVGVVAFVLALGALIAVGGRGLVASVTFTSPAGIGIRIAVGLLLVLLGLVQTEILQFSFHRIERVTRGIGRAEAAFRRKHPVAGFTVFGFAYLIFGFG